MECDYIKECMDIRTARDCKYITSHDTVLGKEWMCVHDLGASMTFPLSSILGRILSTYELGLRSSPCQATSNQLPEMICLHGPPSLKAMAPQSIQDRGRGITNVSFHFGVILPSK